MVATQMKKVRSLILVYYMLSEKKEECLCPKHGTFFVCIARRTRGKMMNQKKIRFYRRFINISVTIGLREGADTQYQ